MLRQIVRPPSTDLAKNGEPTDEATIAPGTLFAERYEILAVLGGGGMGVVYAANDHHAHQSVALKLIHRHLAANAQVFQRFHREATILSHLYGPNLVKLYSFGQDADGRLYMALERIDGLALDQYLNLHGPPTTEQALSLMVQIASALETAHAKGVVHRDLKPANVLLEKREGGFQVRVCDFGLAKALYSSDFASTMITEKNMIFGTPEYMSPEQVAGDDLDERSDIYSAGVVFYEMLTGKPPFLASTSVATMTAHLIETPKPAIECIPGHKISPALSAVLQHAMARARENRYASAGDLKNALLQAKLCPDDVESVHPHGFQSNLFYCKTQPRLTAPSRESLSSIEIGHDEYQDTDRPGKVAERQLPTQLLISRTKFRHIHFVVFMSVTILAGILIGIILSR